MDEDGDLMGDDWEERFFDSSAEDPGNDPDGDGANCLLEYAMGSDPTNIGSLPVLEVKADPASGDSFCSVTFHRRMGTANGLKYRLEFSRDGRIWMDGSDKFTLTGTSNLYDGSGTEKATYKSSVPLGTPLLVRVVIDSE